MSEEKRKLAVARRLARQQNKIRISSYVTPFPVSSFIKEIPEDKVVFRYMFPGKGKVFNACIYMEGDLKKGVEVAAEIRSVKGDGQGVTHIARNVFTTMNLTFDINIGDRLTVAVNSDVPVENLWISFMWVPDVSNVEVKKFLKSELDEVEDEGI